MKCGLELNRVIGEVLWAIGKGWGGGTGGGGVLGLRLGVLADQLRVDQVEGVEDSALDPLRSSLDPDGVPVADAGQDHVELPVGKHVLHQVHSHTAQCLASNSIHISQLKLYEIFC